MARKRRIFTSDIHMGTAESIEGDHPYGWLRKDRVDLLAEFLNELAVDDSLSELVIGGDLFDEWVEPYKGTPRILRLSPWRRRTGPSSAPLITLPMSTV